MNSLMTQEDINDLESHLKNYIGSLGGDFVNKNSGYENAICEIIEGFSESTDRYWDCVWKEKYMHIELKKGTSIWLDLVRYSEVILEKNPNAQTKTFTLFFIPNKEKTLIKEIIGIKTDTIIDKLSINAEHAKQLLSLNEVVPRSFNAQASLTVNDVKKLADFIIEINNNN